jgi:hypothetical protein
VGFFFTSRLEEFRAARRFDWPRRDLDAGGIFCAELKPRNRDVKAERVSLTGDPAEPATKPTSLIGPIKLAISGFVSVARFFIFS